MSAQTFYIAAMIRGEELVWTGEDFRSMRFDHHEFQTRKDALALYDRIDQAFLMSLGIKGPTEACIRLYRERGETVTRERCKPVWIEEA